MAEQEVIKHTRRVYNIWTGSHNFWHKLKEFIIEIIIIVFAVTLSIWLHDNSEHKHQQKEVKEFLAGLRQDLLSDVKEMLDDKESYAKQQKIFTYITSVGSNGTLNDDTLRKYQSSLSNTTRFQQNNGRFEGFKASGKIGNIEDEQLQTDIMDLYQENIPSLLASTDSYINRKNQLFDFAIKNRKRITDSTNNYVEVLLSNEAQNISGYLSNPNEIMNRYDVCILKMKKIVREIEEVYDLEPEGEL